MVDGLQRCEIQRYGTVKENSKGRPDRPVADIVRQTGGGDGDRALVMIGRAEWHEAPPNGTAPSVKVHPEELPHFLRQLRILYEQHFQTEEASDDSE